MAGDRVVAVRRVRLPRQVGPDQQARSVFLSTPGPAQPVYEEQSPPVLLIGPLRGRPWLTRSTALVTDGYPHQVVAVVQLADYVAARGVHDRVGDQLGDDQNRRVAGVLAHGPAGQPGPRQASRLGRGTWMCGQLEPEPALGSGPTRDGSRSGTETEAACGGVCS